METRGRKAKIYDKDEIKAIVYRYIQEEKVSGMITYSDMFRFAKKLYENGEIPYQLSDEFWRRPNRQGRLIIDEANETYKITIKNGKTTAMDVYVDTEECVNKFFSGKPSNKKRLIQALKLNEKKAKDAGKYLSKIEDLKEEISNHKDTINELKALVEQQQMILFSWFNASVKSDVPLMNLVTTGKSRHPIVDYFFETAFTNPAEGYDKFEKYRNRLKDSFSLEHSKDNDVIPMRKSRIQAISEKLKEDTENKL